MVRNILAIGCGLLGGAAGYVGFIALLGQGFYALVLPGGLVGLAAGIVPTQSRLVPLACGVLAIGAGLVAEHRYAPFVVDGGFIYFVRHAGDLQPVTQGLIALGGLIGFWVPFRRRMRRSA